MAEISNAGYQTLRDYIQANWNYFEIRNSSGVAVLRIPTTDSRCTWSHTQGSQVLQLTCIITGSDTDIFSGLPKTIGGSAFYNTAIGGDVLSAANFTEFTMAESGDQLTIKHEIQVPRVA